MSRSEAGQQKALLVLDANWAVEEEIPLDIGPRHFDAAQEAPLDASELSQTSCIPEGLRAGDRLRLTLPPGGDARSDPALSSQLRLLQGQGVHVEVVSTLAPSAAPRIAAAEDLGPVDVFCQYAQATDMAESAMQQGVALLQALPATSGAAAAAQQAVALSFECVEVEGYFSFKECTRYELANRGLVVVTGRVEAEDGSGAKVQGAEGAVPSWTESNGAGKTALVMAPLWALTGQVDARSEASIVFYLFILTFFDLLLVFLADGRPG